MMDLENLLSQAYSYCKNCNIPVPEKELIKIKYNTRAKRWGLCKRNPDGTFEIEINYKLGNEERDLKPIMETILHELCHAARGGFKHTGKWKLYVEKLNNKYGFNIKRVNTAEEKGLPEEYKNKKIKYRFQCQSCGLIIERTKKTKFTKNYNWYRCSKCKGCFKPII